MMTPHETLTKIDEASLLAVTLQEKLNTLLTWGELEPAQREQLSRAANLASWSDRRICGISNADAPVTPGLAKWL